MVEFLGKTKTLFKRNEDFSLNTNELSDRTFTMVEPNCWMFTEKYDGRSVVFHADADEYFGYYGRTAGSTFNDSESAFLADWAMTLTERNNISGKPVALYAELIGPGVNGNSHNLKDFELKFFDVKINGFWLNDVPMRNVLDGFGVETAREVWVPGRYDIYDTFHLLSREIENVNQERYFEGIVAKTEVYLYNNQGDRVMWKLKKTDLEK